MTWNEPGGAESPLFLLFGIFSVRLKLFVPYKFAKSNQYKSLGLKFMGKIFIADSFFFRFFSYVSGFAMLHSS
jgi:hypothetical protein